MISRYFFCLAFIFVGTLMFIGLMTFRGYIFGVHTVLDTLSNETGSNTISQAVGGNLMNYYDIASWLFLLSPWLYLALQVIRQEPQGQEVGY